jgi:acetoin utilization deacetylase AcuC-like enzyme
MPEVSLHSLHHSPVTNVPADTVLPWAEREEVVAFAAPPGAEEYLAAVADSLAALAGSAEALVLSLGYDTVAGDPHGSWDLPPEVFARIGEVVAATGLPVCVIQEGGYDLSVLADCAEAFATGLLEGADGPKTGPGVPFSAHRQGVRG